MERAKNCVEFAEACGHSGAGKDSRPARKLIQSWKRAVSFESVGSEG
jgi:hypothetical protein